MSIYTFFVLQPYAFLAHNIHITDINNPEYNRNNWTTSCLCTIFTPTSPTYSCCLSQPWRFHSSTINAVTPASDQLYTLLTEDSAFIFIWSRIWTTFNSANYSWKIFIYLQPFQRNSPTLNPADHSLKIIIHLQSFQQISQVFTPAQFDSKFFRIISNCSCDSCQHFWLDFFQLEDFPFYLKLNNKTWKRDIFIFLFTSIFVNIT